MILFVDEHTLVPSFKSVRSRVLPAGTSMPLSTMVEQEDLLALALAAEVNVQVEDDFFVRSETREGAGAAETRPAARVAKINC